MFADSEQRKPSPRARMAKKWFAGTGDKHLWRSRQGEVECLVSAKPKDAKFPGGGATSARQDVGRWRAGQEAAVLPTPLEPPPARFHRIPLCSQIRLSSILLQSQQSPNGGRAGRTLSSGQPTASASGQKPLGGSGRLQDGAKGKNHCGTFLAECSHGGWGEHIHSRPDPFPEMPPLYFSPLHIFLSAALTTGRHSRAKKPGPTRNLDLLDAKVPRALTTTHRFPG